MTETLRKSEIERCWFLIDADGKVLGRLATHSAVLLTGKNKHKFSPNIDNGDHVVVINSQSIILTKNKFQKKKYYSHSGYPGGLKVRTAEQLHLQDQTQIIWRAVNGMLAKNKLRSVRINRFHVYSGSEHGHKAQKMIKYKI